MLNETITLPAINFPPLNKPDRVGEVVFVLRRPDGAVWLQTKLDYPEGEYRLPGGGIKQGEDPLATVHREVEEETGFTDLAPCQVGVLAYCGAESSTVDFTTYLFHASCPSAIPVNQDPHELITDWRAVQIADLHAFEKRLRMIEGERRAWGHFRAAALQAVIRLHQAGRL